MALSGGNIDKPFTIIYNSNQQFDPVLDDIGTELNGKDFYAWTKNKALIFERVGARENSGGQRRLVRGTWLIALKWNGSSFRTVCIAVEPSILDEASKLVKRNIAQGTSLNLLREYPFQLYKSAIYYGGTRMAY